MVPQGTSHGLGTTLGTEHGGGSLAINSDECFSSSRGHVEERQGAREPSSLIAMATVHRDGELRGLGGFIPPGTQTPGWGGC